MLAGLRQRAAGIVRPGTEKKPQGGQYTAVPPCLANILAGEAAGVFWRLGASASGRLPGLFQKPQQTGPGLGLQARPFPCRQAGQEQGQTRLRQHEEPEAAERSRPLLWPRFAVAQALGAGIGQSLHVFARCVLQGGQAIEEFRALLLQKLRAGGGGQEESGQGHGRTAGLPAGGQKRVRDYRILRDEPGVGAGQAAVRQEAGPGAERGQGQRLRGAVVVLPPILAHVLQHALLAPADPGQSGTQHLLFPLGLCRYRDCKSK